MDKILIWKKNSRQNPKRTKCDEWTKSQIRQNPKLGENSEMDKILKLDKISNWTKPQIDKIPNGQNSKLNKILNGKKQWSKFRVKQNPE